MVKVTLTDSRGRVHSLTGQEGQSLMELARGADVAGIEAACGGERSCGTCAVIPGPGWQHVLQGASQDERDMLEFTVARPQDCRLSCQVVLGADLDGLEVQVAEPA